MLAEARVALGGEQYERCRRLLESVATTLGPKSGTALVGMAREERILWRLMRTIVLSQEGDVKGAKEMLKGTHKLLDEPAAAGNSVEGVISVRSASLFLPVSTGSHSSTPDSSRYSLLHRSVLLSSNFDSSIRRLFPPSTRDPLPFHFPSLRRPPLRPFRPLSAFSPLRRRRRPFRLGPPQRSRNAVVSRSSSRRRRGRDGANLDTEGRAAPGTRETVHDEE